MTTKPCNSVKLDGMSVIGQQDICYVRMLFFIRQWVLKTLLDKEQHLTMQIEQIDKVYIYL